MVIDTFGEWLIIILGMAICFLTIDTEPSNKSRKLLTDNVKRIIPHPTTVRQKLDEFILGESDEPQNL